jgi:hypothetical protein
MEGTLKEFKQFTNKRGQWHFYNEGKATALCGSQLVGTNYTKFIPSAHYEACPKCYKKALSGLIRVAAGFDTIE